MYNIFYKMKKIIIVAFILLATAAQAQYIIDEDSPDYLFNPYDSTLGLGTYGGDYYHLFGNTGWDTCITVERYGDFRRYYVPAYTDIYGIAITGRFKQDGKILLGLAQRENGIFYYYDTLRLDSTAYKTKFKYVGICRNSGWSSGGMIADSIVDSYEVFFDQPIPIRDTFFVYHIIDTGFCVTTEDSVLFADLCDASLSQYIINWSETKGFYRVLHLYWGLVFPILRPPLLQCDTAWQFRVEEEGDGWTMLRWQSDGSGFYRLHIVGGDIDTTVNVYSTIYTIHGVTAGEEYTAELTHVCNFDLTGNGDTLIYSEPLTLTFTAALGIGEAAWAAALTMSPNPATDEVRIEGFGDAGLQADVMDVQGRRVACRTAPEGSGQLTLDVSHLPAGIYLVRLATPQGTATRRLVLTR